MMVMMTSLSSINAELAFELEELFVVAVSGGDYDVVEEVGSEAWDWEGEVAYPLDSKLAWWAVLGCSIAFEVLNVGDSSIEIAFEVDVVQVWVWKVPKSIDVEMLKLIRFDGVGICVGILLDHNEVPKATDLLDLNIIRAVTGVRRHIIFLFV